MLHTPFQPVTTPSDDLTCDPPHKLRTLQQLEDIFKYDPNQVFAIQSAYVNTPEFGVVTIVRRKAANGADPATYSIGMNLTNQDWPSMRYPFDHDLVPGPLSLVNAAGKVAGIVSYTVLPSAMELLEAVVTSVRRAPSSLSFFIPSEPNLTYCAFR